MSIFVVLMSDQSSDSVAPALRKRRVGLIPYRRRLTIYGIAAGLWLTGVLWLAYHYFVKSMDEFGFENRSPLEHIWLIFHAAFSFVCLWMFGVLWPTHIKIGWSARRHRLTGGVLFAVFCVLTVSGFGLYYIGNEKFRSGASLTHWIVGLAALLVFSVHRFQPLSRLFDRGRSVSALHDID